MRFSPREAAFDENLSARLPESLVDLFPDSDHVRNCGLKSAQDLAILRYAKANGFAIVTKDSDFAEQSVLDPTAPKVIWIRAGNCSTQSIETLLRSAYTTIAAFVTRNEETCLLLQPALPP